MISIEEINEAIIPEDIFGLDLVMLRYAVSFSDIDSIAVTYYDRMANTTNPFYYIDGYQNEKLGELNSIEPSTENNLHTSSALTSIIENSIPLFLTCKTDIIDLIEEDLKIKVSIISFGKTALNKSVLTKI